MPIMLNASHQGRDGKYRLINSWQANTEITLCLILKATMNRAQPPPKYPKKKENAFQVKELREAISTSAITSSELIRY